MAGFHEVLLHKADGSGLVARLIGISERIESVRFSPDGKQLAVTGGKPARMGEVQIWNVAKQTLELWLCPQLAEGRQNYHRPSQVEFDATRTLPGRQAVGM